MSVAIATVYDGADAYQCAMPLWCASASEIASNVPNSRLIIFGPHPSEDCPRAQHIWGDIGRETEAAARQYLGRNSVKGGWAYLKTAALLKVGVLALVQFRLILYVDLDADLQPRGPYGISPLKAGEWRASIEAFHSSSAKFVSSPDHASPVNTGVWLYKPDIELYTDTIDVLRRGVWSEQYGFDGAGLPSEIAYDEDQIKRLAAGREKWDAQYGLDRALGLTRQKMHMTAFARENTWFFVGGNIDQGLFWYIMYVKHGVGTWASFQETRWRVHHFWGPGKPWGATNAPGVAARVNYLQRLMQWGRLASANNTACKRHLEALWRDAVARGANTANDSPGWTPHMTPVLPTTTVVHFQLPKTAYAPKRNSTVSTNAQSPIKPQPPFLGGKVNAAGKITGRIYTTTHQPSHASAAPKTNVKANNAAKSDGTGSSRRFLF